MAGVVTWLLLVGQFKPTSNGVALPQQNKTIEHLDLYQVMRAAGQVETLLGLSAHTKYDQPGRGRN